MKRLTHRLRLPGDPAPRSDSHSDNNPGPLPELTPLHEVLRAVVFIAAVLVLAFALLGARV